MGGRTHIVGDEIAFDPAALLAEVERAGVTVFETVPSMLRAMPGLPTEVTKVSVCLGCGGWCRRGRRCRLALSRAWFERYPHVAQMNAYGPTECSDDVTHFTMREALAEEVMTMPIGQPVGNLRIYILDGHGQPAPVGVAGEIYVGGVGVGRGYLHDPARTAAAFVPDPFGGEPGGRLYRTGDLGRWRQDISRGMGHTIEFLGRVDDQVKVRGHRIELGEIEHVLGETSGGGGMCGGGSAGRGRRGAVGGVRSLAGRREGRHEDIRGVRAGAFAGLYGAVSLRVLAGIAQDWQWQARPQGPAAGESRCPGTWKAPYSPAHSDGGEGGGDMGEDAGSGADSADEPVVGIHDNFYDLGGHSLLAVRVVNEIRQSLEVDVTLRSMFEFPTVAEMASAIDGGQFAAMSKLLAAPKPLPRTAFRRKSSSTSSASSEPDR